MHHIIPRHMGGTDDPANLVALTIEEHADAHYKLYETYGKIEDKIAYLGLLKQIGQEEILLEKSKLGGKGNKGITKTAEHKIKMSKNAAGGVTKHITKTKETISNKMKNNTNSACHNTDEYKKKQSEAMKLAWQRKKNNSV
jgi:hypothetical protein